MGLELGGDARRQLVGAGAAPSPPRGGAFRQLGTASPGRDLDRQKAAAAESNRSP